MTNAKRASNILTYFSLISRSTSSQIDPKFTIGALPAHPLFLHSIDPVAVGLPCDRRGGAGVLVDLRGEVRSDGGYL